MITTLFLSYCFPALTKRSAVMADACRLDHAIAMGRYDLSRAGELQGKSHRVTAPLAEIGEGLCREGPR